MTSEVDSTQVDAIAKEITEELLNLSRSMNATQDMNFVANYASNPLETINMVPIHTVYSHINGNMYTNEAAAAEATSSLHTP